MNKNKIRWLIQMRKGEYDHKKFRRMIFTILFYSVFWICVIYAQNQLDTTNIWHIIGEIVACVFFGGVTFYVNALIFTQLHTMSDSENKEIDRLKKQLEEMEQQEQKNTQITNRGKQNDTTSSTI